MKPDLRYATLIHVVCYLGDRKGTAVLFGCHVIDKWSD